jgi:myo-inositol-1(or 4)-monophosphatase
MSDLDLKELREWLHECGTVAKSFFNHVKGTRKSDRSWVTEADVQVERILSERLARRYPSYGILGEEQARSGTNREFVWALDPIDGTAGFVAGLPIWGISLGLLRNGRPHAGLLYFPMMEDWYWAEPGGPALFNGTALAVAATGEWDSEDWLSVPANTHRRFDIDFVGKIRSLGSTAASICYAARGSAIGSLFVSASIWDVAAALAVLQASGGVAETLSGAPFDCTVLLDGSQQREPALAGAPWHVAALRERIHIRRWDRQRESSSAHP